MLQVQIRQPHHTKGVKIATSSSLASTRLKRVVLESKAGNYESGSFHPRSSSPKTFHPWSFSIYCLAVAFEHYRQVYIVHSWLQDESLQVTISKLP